MRRATGDSWGRSHEGDVGAATRAWYQEGLERGEAGERCRWLRSAIAWGCRMPDGQSACDVLPLVELTRRGAQIGWQRCRSW